jgi:predicted AAA+ superfamily ATPase
MQFSYIQEEDIMLRRKISEDLLKWKNNPDRLSLLVKGARQVGKTFIIRRFAEEHYRHFVEINFYENEGHRAIFDGDLNVETIIKQISLRLPNANFTPAETLLFLDEIQECPRARTALKFLAIDRRFDVIASGSMLGIKYREVPSFPAGYIDLLEMHSLDFEEFLWANGVKPDSIADIRSYYEKHAPVPVAMHERMLELFKEYIVVGGMPRVVSTFVARHNFAEVLRIQKAIVEDYKEDIAK